MSDVVYYFDMLFKATLRFNDSSEAILIHLFMTKVKVLK